MVVKWDALLSVTAPFVMIDNLITLYIFIIHFVMQSVEWDTLLFIAALFVMIDYCIH